MTTKVLAANIKTNGDLDPSNPHTNVTLDPTLYNPSPEAVAFYKQQTGITSDDELKEHILSIQKEAWDVRSVSRIFCSSSG